MHIAIQCDATKWSSLKFSSQVSVCCITMCISTRVMIQLPQCGQNHTFSLYGNATHSCVLSVPIHITCISIVCVVHVFGCVCVFFIFCIYANCDQSSLGKYQGLHFFFIFFIINLLCPALTEPRYTSVLCTPLFTQRLKGLVVVKHVSRSPRLPFWRENPVMRQDADPFAGRGWRREVGIGGHTNGSNSRLWRVHRERTDPNVKGHTEAAVAEGCTCIFYMDKNCQYGTVGAAWTETNYIEGKVSVV